jgi:hypothetical protein
MSQNSVDWTKLVNGLPQASRCPICVDQIADEAPLIIRNTHEHAGHGNLSFTVDEAMATRRSALRLLDRRRPQELACEGINM